MSKDDLKQKQHLIDLMNMKTDKELAMALVNLYISIGCLFANAIQCAKLDLQHSIEVLEKVRMSYMVDSHKLNLYLFDMIKSLRSQLEHLNSI